MSVLSEYDDPDIEIGGQDTESVATTSMQSPPRISEQPKGSIPNSPLHPQEESEGEYEDKNHIPNSSEINPVWSLSKNLFGILLFSIAMGMICILVYISHDFTWYNILTTKSYQGNTSQGMEFIRICFTLWATFIAYLSVDGFLIIAPSIVLFWVKFFGGKPSKTLTRNLGYFERSRDWIKYPFFILSIAILYGQVLYVSTFFKRLQSSLLGKAPAKKATDLALIPPVKNEFFYIERFILLSVVFFILLGLARFLKEFISLNFNRQVFQDRARKLNSRFRVVMGLFGILRFPSRSRSTSKVSLRRRTEDEFDCHLAPDVTGDFTKEAKVLEVAHIIFEALREGSSREFLTKEDLAPYFEPENLDHAFELLNPNKDGQISYDGLRQALLEIYIDRLSIQRGLENNELVLGKLHSTLIVVACFLTFTFGMPIFELSGSAIFVVFGLLWTGMSFLFNNTFKTYFESLVFVFMQHPYDIGDRVLIDNELLRVEKIEIYTTVFRRWDGMATYMQNSVLCGKNIGNLRRSGDQSEFIDLLFPASTATISKVWKLRERIQAFVKSECNDFTGQADIATFENDGDRVKVSVMLEYRGNFQDHVVKVRRKNKFMAALRSEASELEMTLL